MANVRSRLSKLFGVSEKLAKELLQNMNYRVEPDKNFFVQFLSQIQNPKYFIPSENHPLPIENELHVNNMGNFKHGKFGFVKPNKSRGEFIYKFVHLNKDNLTDVKIRDILKEPFINFLLQEDPNVSPYVMKIYAVFWNPETYQLIFKLENMGLLLQSMLAAGMIGNKENNKKLVLNIYGPLYNTLEYLRKTYSFEHNDLHKQNIMFSNEVAQNLLDRNYDALYKGPIFAKMIDFGLSNLDKDGFLLGTSQEGEALDRSQKETTDLLFLLRRPVLPDDFVNKIREHSGNKFELEQYIIEEWKRNKVNIGGSRRTSKKTIYKRKQTRRAKNKRTRKNRKLSRFT